MLRGGGAVYHLFSDQAINGFYQSGSPDILYSSSTLSYDDAWSGTNQYDVYAPTPLTLGQVNSSRIDGLRTKKQSLLDGRYQQISTAITTSNIGSQSVSYATNSGNSATTSQTTFSSLAVNNNSTFSGQSTWFGGYGGGSGPGIALENLSTFARFAFWGLDFYDWNHGIQMTIDNAYVSATNSFRAPIFYDSQDTTYYVDPNSTSNLAASYIGRVLINHDGTDTWFRMQSGNRMRITTTGGTDFIIPNTGEMSYNGNTVIHTGNIGSQSVSYATTSGSANSVAWTNVSGRPTNVSSFTNDSGYLTSLPSHNHDDRYYTETESDSRYLYYRGYSTSGNTQNFQSTANTIRFDQVGALDNGAWSNQPTGYYTYGGILSLRGASFGLQIYGSHTGDLAFKTQWDNDQYSGWRTIISSANIGSQSVSYASSAGNADTVDGYHATNAASGLAYYASNGYLYVPSWINVGSAGIFSSTNNAHIRPNTATYGAWEMIGSKGGWSGIFFNDSGDYLMANNNEVGHYQNGVGWKFRWYQGEMYISSGTTGGGTERTVIHSGNIGSQSVSYATTAGTANAVAWGNVSSRPTALSQFTNDLGNYGGWITSSGNAATATNVAWTGVTGRPTALSQFSNDLGNYGGWLTTGGKAADSELFDGTDSIYFVKGNGVNALGYRTTNHTGGNSAGGLVSFDCKFSLQQCNK
jgi:hypothetical protein